MHNYIIKKSPEQQEFRLNFGEIYLGHRYADSYFEQLNCHINGQYSLHFIPFNIEKSAARDLSI